MTADALPWAAYLSAAFCSLTKLKIGAPRLRFLRHSGIYRSDVAELQPNPGAEADRLPLVGPEAQVEERAGRNTLSLIVAMSSDRLSLDRVGRHQSPSPFHRHEQITTLFPRGHSIPEGSTLPGTGTFYFASQGTSFLCRGKT
jgi:hypothetical protein